MKTVRVNLGKDSYEIYIGQDLFQQAARHFTESRSASRILLLSNPTVFDFYGDQFLSCFREFHEDVTCFLIPDGEKYKSLETVENIYTYLIAQRVDRKAALVALGGGVTGDVAGFVAATYLRGISYVQVPTTLLAQVDSSVGGKTGVNHRLGKNLIGAFYQPRAVYIDPDTLSTLPQKEYESGLYEVVKYGLIYDAEFFDFFEANLETIKRRDPEILEVVVSRSCEIKAEVISLDEREEDLRRILNFGHTFAHALETCVRYQGITHGAAVGYGMIAASLLSKHQKLLSEEQCSRVIRVIQKIGTLPRLQKISFEGLYDVMQHDKKAEQGQLVFILLAGIGKTRMQSGIDKSLLRDVWSQTQEQTALVW